MEGNFICKLTLKNKWFFLIHTWSVKALKGTFVNQSIAIFAWRVTKN